MIFYTYKNWLKRTTLIKNIKKYRKNPTLVVEQLLGIKFTWYQKLILKYLGWFDLRFRNGSKIRIPLNYKRRNNEMYQLP